MRLIDADALLDKLKLYVNGSVIGMIEQAPTIDAVPRWIPCEEKLPEPVQEVLVTGTNNCVYTSRIVHGEFEYGGNVIAWMPLPEPYEEERRDDEID